MLSGGKPGSGPPWRMQLEPDLTGLRKVISHDVKDSFYFYPYVQGVFYKSGVVLSSISRPFQLSL